MGTETSDDAGVYRLNDETALIQTLDFFTPIVDDPYDFGRIAAANALSDVYAMGGRPLLCMNILACPTGTMETGVFRKVVEGGLAKVREAGALLVGGHSIEDGELKYGLSVTGLVHPDRVWTNSGARQGDILVLTKPLGTGILSTAIKGELGGPEVEERLVAVMATLNHAAPAILQEAVFSVAGACHSCTDITGFGLFGHLHEMAAASGTAMRVRAESLPLLPGAVEFAEMGIIPAGAYANRRHYAGFMVSSHPEGTVLEMLGFDPQTSGGLLLALEKTRVNNFLERLESLGETFGAVVIGEVVSGVPGTVYFD